MPDKTAHYRPGRASPLSRPTSILPHAPSANYRGRSNRVFREERASNTPRSCRVDQTQLWSRGSRPDAQVCTLMRQRLASKSIRHSATESVADGLRRSQITTRGGKAQRVGKRERRAGCRCDRVGRQIPAVESRPQNLNMNAPRFDAIAPRTHNASRIGRIYAIRGTSIGAKGRTTWRTRARATKARRNLGRNPR